MKGKKTVVDNPYAANGPIEEPLTHREAEVLWRHWIMGQFFASGLVLITILTFSLIEATDFCGRCVTLSLIGSVMLTITDLGAALVMTFLPMYFIASKKLNPKHVFPLFLGASFLGYGLLFFWSFDLMASFFELPVFWIVFSFIVKIYIATALCYRMSRRFSITKVGSSP